MILELLFTVAIGLVYFWKKNRMKYWERHGIKLVGDALPLLTQKASMGEFFQGIYRKNKEHKFVGIYIFSNPLLAITDPKVFEYLLMNKHTSFHYSLSLSL